MSNPSVHTRFKPGQSGNPAGRQKQAVASDTLKTMLQKLLGMPKESLKKHMQDPDISVHEYGLAKAIVQAAEAGQFHIFEAIYNRSIGRVKEVSEIHQHNVSVDQAIESDRDSVLELLRRVNG